MKNHFKVFPYKNAPTSYLILLLKFLAWLGQNCIFQISGVKTCFSISMCIYLASIFSFLFFIVI